MSVVEEVKADVLTKKTYHEVLDYIIGKMLEGHPEYDMYASGWSQEDHDFLGSHEIKCKWDHEHTKEHSSDNELEIDLNSAYYGQDILMTHKSPSENPVLVTNYNTLKRFLYNEYLENDFSIHAHEVKIATSGDSISIKDEESFEKQMETISKNEDIIIRRALILHEIGYDGKDVPNYHHGLHYIMAIRKSEVDYGFDNPIEITSLTLISEGKSYIINSEDLVKMTALELDKLAEDSHNL